MIVTVNDMVLVDIVDEAILIALGLLESKIVQFTLVLEQMLGSLVLPIKVYMAGIYKIQYYPLAK